MDNKDKIETRDLTDRDFYEQACSYFYYHAEQRTTMINYFIAVFAAGLALYGSLIEKYPAASALISFFLLIVSVIFHLIDLRNRFDVKQSQCVICQIESDYSINTLRNPEDLYVYGVFSNEDNVFNCYGYSKRKDISNAKYREFRKKYKTIVKNGSDNDKLEALKEEIKAYYKKEDKVSAAEVMSSFKNPSIITLSFSIKMLYYLCMAISIMILVIALIIAF